MTQYTQDNLPGMDEAIARAEQSGLDAECCQMHLARWFCRFGKYQRFSKDPKFQQRCWLAKHKGKNFDKWCEDQKMDIAKMMGNVGR